MVAPTIVRMTMLGDIATRACHNIVDVSLDEFATSRETMVQALMVDFDKLWQDTILPALGGWYTYHGMNWIDLDSPDGLTGFKAPRTGKPVLGGTGGSLHTPNTAALIHKSTGSRRGHRSGRMYLAPILESDTDDGGNLSAGALTRFNSAANSLRTTINAAGAPIFATVAYRVVHVDGYTGDPVPGYPNGYPNAWSSSDVTSVSTDSKCATQRRRLRG